MSNPYLEEDSIKILDKNKTLTTIWFFNNIINYLLINYIYLINTY